MKNLKMANKGMLFEKEIEMTNDVYLSKGMALVQKISTPWNIIRNGKQIISAFPTGKSTLDFRGTISKGVPISFDCKESQNEKGLPLSHIPSHQIEYMENAIKVGEISFILTYIIPLNRRFLIKGEVVVEKYHLWKQNYKKRGFAVIPISEMIEITSSNGAPVDYIKGVKKAYFSNKRKEE